MTSAMISATAGVGTALAPQGAAQTLPNTPIGRPMPKPEREPPVPHEQRLGWAVVGLGDFAVNYVLPGFARARLSRPAALVSGNADKARELAARYGINADAIYSYETMDRLSQNPDVDVIYIVTPNATHADLTIRAFEAGKHVMCEKPMANSPADCQRMIAAAQASGKKLMIAYRVHWEPHNVRLKQMVDAGELGEVWFASSDHHRPLDPSLPRDEWRMKKAIAGGGSLVDIGIYSLNGIQWLFGESPVAVAASMVSPPNDKRFTEVENVFTAELAFASGRRATLSSGYTASKKRLDLWGDKKVATLDPATAYQGNRLILSSSDKAEEVLVSEPSSAQFTGEIDHLSEAIRQNTAVKTPGEMGLRDVRIIEALYRAATERRWIDLNPDMTMRS